MDVFCIDSVDINSIECIRDPCLVSTVSTYIVFNALHVLIFILTASTKKIPYSIHNSIALIFCIDCLDMPFNVHSNYNVDSNMKTSN